VAVQRSCEVKLTRRCDDEIGKPIQIVPEIAHLPDMDKAFMKAEQLAREK
jgi:hypothetical protein